MAPVDTLFEAKRFFCMVTFFGIMRESCKSGCYRRLDRVSACRDRVQPLTRDGTQCLQRFLAVIGEMPRTGSDVRIVRWGRLSGGPARRCGARNSTGLSSRRTGASRRRSPSVRRIETAFQHRRHPSCCFYQRLGEVVGSFGLPPSAPPCREGRGIGPNEWPVVSRQTTMPGMPTMQSYSSHEQFAVAGSNSRHSNAQRRIAEKLHRAGRAGRAQSFNSRLIAL